MRGSSTAGEKANSREDLEQSASSMCAATRLLPWHSLGRGRRSSLPLW